MNNQTANSNPVPANLAALLQSSGLPLPNGTDENGNPFWSINGQTINWAQMQQHLWLRQQQMSQSAPKSGGVEAMPQMPTMATPDTMPDVKMENKVEVAGEKAPEKTNNTQPATSNVASGQQTAQGAKPAKAKKPSYLGDGPQLTTVDTSDPVSMLSYVQANEKQPPTSSKRFIAVMLNRILSSLSLGN